MPLDQSKIAIRGQLSSASMSDVLATVEASSQSAEVCVQSDVGSGTIWFKAGCMVDAEMGGLTGEAALIALLGLDTGTFEVRHLPVNRQVTIRSSVKELLGQGTRRRRLWADLVNRIPGLAAVLKVNEEVRDDLGWALEQDELDLLGRVNGKRSIQEVISGAGRDAVESLTMLVTLFEAGLFRVASQSAWQHSSEAVAVLPRAPNVPSMVGELPGEPPRTDEPEPEFPQQTRSRYSSRPNSVEVVFPNASPPRSGPPMSEGLRGTLRGSGPPTATQPEDQETGTNQGSDRPPSTLRGLTPPPPDFSQQGGEANAMPGGPGRPPPAFTDPQAPMSHWEAAPAPHPAMTHDALRTTIQGHGSPNYVQGGGVRPTEKALRWGISRLGTLLGHPPPPPSLRTDGVAETSHDYLEANAAAVAPVPGTDLVDRALPAQVSGDFHDLGMPSTARGHAPIPPDQGQVDREVPAQNLTRRSEPPVAIESLQPGVDARPAAAPQTFLGRYEVLTRIGRGGMGSVYLCRITGEAGFRRLFALKVLRGRLRDDAEAAQLFLQEARVAARVHHPNVVAVVDASVQGTQPYLVMDYVEGCSLHTLLDQNSAYRPPELILAIILDALNGLHAIHTLTAEDGSPLGLVHCDISPDNLLVGVDGACRISDFGITRMRSAGLGSPSTRGKAAYLAPERAAGRQVDQRADLFSMGVVLYNALTGLRLFQAETIEETLHNVHHAQVIPPSRVGLRPPEWLDPVCLGALARNPHARYSSADEMMFELKRVMARHELLARVGDVAMWVRRTVGPELQLRRLATLDGSRRATGAVRSQGTEPATRKSEQRSQPPPPVQKAQGPGGSQAPSPAERIQSDFPERTPPLRKRTDSVEPMFKMSKVQAGALIAASVLAIAAVLACVLWPAAVGKFFSIDEGTMPFSADDQTLYEGSTLREQKPNSIAPSPATGAPSGIAPSESSVRVSPAPRADPSREPGVP